MENKGYEQPKAFKFYDFIPVVGFGTWAGRVSKRSVSGEGEVVEFLGMFTYHTVTGATILGAGIFTLLAAAFSSGLEKAIN
jgi:hypothetical protein